MNTCIFWYQIPRGDQVREFQLQSPFHFGCGDDHIRCLFGHLM